MNDQESRSPAVSAPEAALMAPLQAEDRSPNIIASTVKYLLRTEVHTFAFSVAANALLSFFPFVLLLMTVIRRVLALAGDVWGGGPTAS